MRVFSSYDLAELAAYMDWTPFFQTWELKGRYPAILEDEKQGEAARSLFADAQAMLKTIIAEKWFAPKAVVGFWPAARDGDDIQLFADDLRHGGKDALAAFDKWALQAYRAVSFNYQPGAQHSSLMNAK